MPFSITGFQDQRHQPLGHPSMRVHPEAFSKALAYYNALCFVCQAPKIYFQILDIPRRNRYNNFRSEAIPMPDAGVMELADVTDSKSVGLITRVGSSPTAGTDRDRWQAAILVFLPRTKELPQNG